MKQESKPIDTYEAVKRINDILKRELERIPQVTEVSSQQARIQTKYHNDSILWCNMKNRRIELAVDYKSLLTPGRLRASLEYTNDYDAFLEKDYVRVIAAPKLSVEVRELLEERGKNYVDFAGNMLLIHDSLYIRIEGKTIKLEDNTPRSDVFHRSSVKSRYILRKLLDTDPGRSWLITELVNDSGASYGQTHKVLQQLIEKGYVVHDKGYTLIDPKGLMKEWASVYHRRPTQKTEYYSMDSIPKIEKTIQEFYRGRGIPPAFTGFSAAARLAPSVIYKRVHFYIAEGLDELAESAGWKKGGSGANITAYTPPDPQLLVMKHDYRDKDIVAPSQVILDLLGLAGRGEEAAEAVMMEVFSGHAGR